MPPRRSGCARWMEIRATSASTKRWPLKTATLGYEATALTNSAEALERFRKAPHDYDLVISDITMPEYSGIDLARLMLEIKPDPPIILITGYSELVSKEKAADLGVRAVLLKPYRIPELIEEVRKALPVGKAARG